MTATEIIREIEGLPSGEQAAVIRFAYRLAGKRRLSPGELGSLAEQLAASPDDAESAVVREEIIQGFYGEPRA